MNLIFLKNRLFDLFFSKLKAWVRKTDQPYTPLQFDCTVDPEKIDDEIYK